MPVCWISGVAGFVEAEEVAATRSVRLTPIENYISAHANVLFSHGLCQECSETAYRDLGPDPEDGAQDHAQPGWRLVYRRA